MFGSYNSNSPKVLQENNKLNKALNMFNTSQRETIMNKNKMEFSLINN